MLIRIMACKEREENVNKLLLSLGEWATPIWDTDHNSCHTLCRVLDSDEPMLVLEDDIELCENFLKRAMVEIDEHSDSFVMFYSCKNWEKVEAENKRLWIPYNRPFVFTQAYYVPAWIGKKLSKFLETNTYANRHRYSIGINQFLIEEWIDRYLVQPSLVQHIGKVSIWDAGKNFPMHQSKTYRYEDLPIKKEMKLNYNPQKESYVDFLKKKLWIKKKKPSKKKEENK